MTLQAVYDFIVEQAHAGNTVKIDSLKSLTRVTLLNKDGEVIAVAHDLLIFAIEKLIQNSVSEGR